MRGILQIVIGAIFILGGLSGKLVLLGTNSGQALAVFGGVLVVIGFVRMAKAR